MVVLIDTNVIIDFIAQRSQFYSDAEEILNRCANGVMFGYIAVNTVSDIFYILRKEYSVEKRKAALYDLCDTVRVIGLEHEDVLNVIADENFSDLEDCMQNECAEKINADYIITRNTDDFRNSTIPAITPSDFLLTF